jgi:hypothetical protein
MSTIIEYTLWDKQGEPLFSINGNKYIAQKGEQVDFYDIIQNNWVEYSGIVESIQYSTYKDTVCINCVINQTLTEIDEQRIINYNKSKYEPTQDVQMHPIDAATSR